MMVNAGRTVNRWDPETVRAFQAIERWVAAHDAGEEEIEPAKLEKYRRALVEWEATKGGW